MRTFDKDIVTKATSLYADEIVGLDVEEWLKDDQNIALTNKDGDVSMFEHFYPGAVYGHYFYHNRGKAAIETATSHLKELFENYDVKLIQGLTPITHLGARWLAKKIGCKSQGIIHTKVGPCELFLISKEEWENNK